MFNNTLNAITKKIFLKISLWDLRDSVHSYLKTIKIKHLKTYCIVSLPETFLHKKTNAFALVLNCGE